MLGVVPQQTLVVVTRTHEGFYLPELAHLRLARRGLGDPVAFFPADHYVSDDRRFMTYVEAAFDADDPQHAHLPGIGRTVRTRASGRPSVHAGHNLKAWRFRILRNTFISRYRRDRNNPVVTGFDTVASTVVAEEPCFFDDIELDRLRTVVGAEIEAALMALSDDARMVVLLDLEGLTEQEMAAVMGCAPGTVKSRLFRARAALRRSLNDYASRETWRSTKRASK